MFIFLADADPVSILTLIRRWIPNASLHSSHGAEMTFVLPTMRKADFYGLFRELDSQKHALDIVNYGISDPKLEEVTTIILLFMCLLHYS